MRYLLIYLGYPRKSIKDATAQQINRMTPEERAKYVQLPMNGTLEEVVKKYIAENKIRKTKAATLALALGLDPRNVCHPDWRGRNIVRYSEGGVPISSTISRETLKRIEEYKARQNIPSISEAVDVLLQIALGQTEK